MYIKLFSEIGKMDTALAGGKGASLGEMTQAGISVPPGFVVLAGAFDAFLKETDLGVEIDSILHSVNHKEMHTVEDASEKIQALILDATMPKDIADEIERQFAELGAEFVAVRSSATAEDSSTAAWAGQLESFLNTTHGNLLENIKRCWASLFTPRAIFYRFEKGLHDHKISVAVVVQKMVVSESSGIAFSVHPVTEDYNQLIIEAGWGLGEAIVSGQITPDSYVVEKEPRRIIDKNISSQGRALYRAVKGGNEWRDVPKEIDEAQVLADSQILDLTELILKIEQHYDFPVDIEWARENGKFYIVQSRPITTLTDNVLLEKVTLSKIFSREKPLLYFSVWDDSDRRGWRDFVNYKVQQNLFIVPPPGKKGSVWYSAKELKRFDVELKRKLKEDQTLIPRLRERLDSNWVRLFPYLHGEKDLESGEEFTEYYEYLVDWWSAMSAAFYIPDIEDVDVHIRETFLSYRTQSEKYTEQMSRLLVAFWGKLFPDHKDLAFCITPQEVIRLTDERDENLLHSIQERIRGCIMLNGTVFPLKELENVLAQNSLVLEELLNTTTDVFLGTPAYKGKVRGVVRKILAFKDMPYFKSGEILVTEMTNPDYVPIMKRAAAIITDEGGTTCHAAITSRELHITCIVGTKIATQILKDGDMVEVDANNGIVKIIK